MSITTKLPGMLLLKTSKINEGKQKRQGSSSPKVCMELSVHLRMPLPTDSISSLRLLPPASLEGKLVEHHQVWNRYMTYIVEIVCHVFKRTQMTVFCTKFVRCSPGQGRHFRLLISYGRYFRYIYKWSNQIDRDKAMGPIIPAQHTLILEAAYECIWPAIKDTMGHLRDFQGFS